MNQELIEKAKIAKSPEEIMKIAEENDIYMVKEEAESIYKQLHTSGEMSDEELAGAAGGCKGAGGRTIVTSGCKCFTGKFDAIDLADAGYLGTCWYLFSKGEACGRCKHLEFKNGIGYCGVE